MIDIRFEIGGRTVRTGDIGSALDKLVFEAIVEDLHEKLGGIRDPETGEFPSVVVRGRSLEDCSISVEGSEAIMALVKERMGSSYVTEEDAHIVARGESPPNIFLCHASEDKALVRRIAEDLNASGIDVFFDAWCIEYGDSLRQRIDEGLEGCTHFVVVLTETSLTKPWVNAEMDAGFVRKLAGHCRFVPLRYNLAAERLPPLLAGLSSPQIVDYERDIETLVRFFHGVSNRPPMGDAPEVVQTFDNALGISPAAKAVVNVMMSETEHGLGHDPAIDAETLRSSTGLTENELVDAVFELESRQNVRRIRAMAEGTIGFIHLVTQPSLFVDFDEHYNDWFPAEDGRRIAALLVNGDKDSASVPELAERLGWPPRRMNPAIGYLQERDAIESGSESGTHPWRCLWIRAGHTTRRLIDRRQ